MNPAPNIGHHFTAQDHELTDAQLIGSWAADALRMGRYPLAAELTRLAQRAHAAAGHNVPDQATAARAAREMFGPGVRELVDVPHMGPTRDEVPRSHAPSTCGAVDVHDGQASVCGAPIRYSDGSHGAPVGWYHLDASIVQHEALPQG